MRGWAYPLDGDAAPEGAVGIVVAQNFPDEKLLKETLRQGIARKGTKVVWVMLNEPKANHAARWAAEVFEEFEVTPLYAPLLPFWQRKGTWKKTVKVPLDECEQDKLTFVEYTPDYDNRAIMRESELRRTCERIVVFHDAQSATTGEWKNFSPWDSGYVEGSTPCRAKINIVTAGKPKAKARKSGKKPIGA